MALRSMHLRSCRMHHTKGCSHWGCVAVPHPLQSSPWQVYHRCWCMVQRRARHLFLSSDVRCLQPCGPLVQIGNHHKRVWRWLQRRPRQVVVPDSGDRYPIGWHPMHTRPCQQQLPAKVAVKHPYPWSHKAEPHVPRLAACPQQCRRQDHCGKLHGHCRLCVVRCLDARE